MNEFNQPVVYWQEIERAKSYKVYSAYNPKQRFFDWNRIGWVDECFFVDLPGQNTVRFYRVVASMEEIE